MKMSSVFFLLSNQSIQASVVIKGEACKNISEVFVFSINKGDVIIQVLPGTTNFLEGWGYQALMIFNLTPVYL